MTFLQAMMELKNNGKTTEEIIDGLLEGYGGLKAGFKITTRDFDGKIVLETTRWPIVSDIRHLFKMNGIKIPIYAVPGQFKE